MENSKDYIDTISPNIHFNERPIGVSGILRCQNHADFLELCIDSTIGGLDELIVVYHDCTDDTVEILLKKQKQYFPKLKIYEYKPYIFPLEMEKELFMFVKQLPDDSIHLFPGYCNFALSKASYRYVIKVDADQAYFSDYWKRLCDAYRNTRKVHLNCIERLAYQLYQSYILNFSRTTLFYQFVRRVAVLFHPFYLSYIEKRVINEKVAVSLSGINLFYFDDHWKISLGQKAVKELFPIFNGAHDHFFFKLSDKNVFKKWVAQGYSADRPRILEIMPYQDEILDAGFMWFHMKPLMNSQRYKSKQLYGKYKKRFVLLQLLKDTPYRQFCKRFHPVVLSFLESTYSYFFDAQRKRIPWEILNLLENQNKRIMETIQKQKRDYYVEYYEELYKKLISFINTWDVDGQVWLGKHSIEKPLQTFLFYRLSMERDHYNKCRLAGMSIDASMKRVNALLDILKKEDIGVIDKIPPKINNIEDHPWCDLLREYRGVLVVYIFNARQLAYFTPLLHYLNRPVLLLSEYDIPEDTKLPETIMALSLEFSRRKLLADSTFERKFPLIFHYANTFDILLQILHPCGVVCLEGAHFQEQLLAVVAKSYNIPSFVIQQGWPSMMHAGFRDLPFSYFFTWGEQYSNLWAKYNPYPRFIPVGYMYEVPPARTEIKKCVSFFLQSPFYLSDNEYFEALLDLISIAAQNFPDVTFLVREHPEYKLDAFVIDKWKELYNIEIVSDCELQEVYARTRIVISHFSSSLMEGVLYNAVPLVFDPTTKSRYYPDVEELNLGRIVTSTSDFLLCLKNLLKNPWKPFSPDIMKKWFAATGGLTLDRMVKLIEETCYE